MKNEMFSVGEIAVVIGGCSTDFIGSEVTVVGPLRQYRGIDTVTGKIGMYFGYEVGHPAFRSKGIMEPKYLRKRRPPLDPAFMKFRDQLVREFAMDACV